MATNGCAKIGNINGRKVILMLENIDKMKI